MEKKKIAVWDPEYFELCEMHPFGGDLGPYIDKVKEDFAHLMMGGYPVQVIADFLNELADEAGINKKWMARAGADILNKWRNGKTIDGENCAKYYPIKTGEDND